MRIVVVLLALLACGGRSTRSDASGSLILELPAATNIESYMATEAEVLRSDSLRRRLKDQMQEELVPHNLLVTVRPGTRVIDVAIRDDDPNRAARLCNDLIRVYLESRIAANQEKLMVQEQAIAAQLEKQPGDPKLTARMQELELARHEYKSDARVLDACTTTASRR